MSCICSSEKILACIQLARTLYIDQSALEEYIALWLTSSVMTPSAISCAVSIENTDINS